MATASVGYLVIDSTDPSALAPFWCALLDVAVDATIGDGTFVVLAPTADGLTVGFQKVPEGKRVRVTTGSSGALALRARPLRRGSPGYNHQRDLLE